MKNLSRVQQKLHARFLRGWMVATPFWLPSGAQKRQSGEPYYSHPLEVAYMVAEHRFTTDVLVTSILHDTIEDTELTKEMIDYIFGFTIASQVEDLTRIKIDGKISVAEMVKSLWFQNKKDLLLIKYFDRLHNMRTINAKSPEKIQKTASETIEIFLILASYLEMSKTELELKTLCCNNFKSSSFYNAPHVFVSEGSMRLPFPTSQSETTQRQNPCLAEKK